MIASKPFVPQQGSTAPHAACGFLGRYCWDIWPERLQNFKVTQKHIILCFAVMAAVRSTD